jgi:queuine/archaeosine tRNA-ribosyltransferase
MIKLEDLLLNEDVLREIESTGIHDFLDFEGRIVLSTISPDEVLDKLDGKKYAELVSAINPDMAMTLDCYTYLDHPLEISWNQLFGFIKNAIVLMDNTDIPLLGIVKGATYKQVTWCLEHLLELGFNTLVVHYRELAREGSMGKRFFGHMLTIIGNATSGYKETDIIVYGKRFLEPNFYHPKFHFASLSWFLRAKERIIYVGEETKNLELNILYDCNCEFCGGREWRELVKDVKSLSLHNLSETISLFEKVRS